VTATADGGFAFANYLGGAGATGAPAGTLGEGAGAPGATTGGAAAGGKGL